MYIKTFTELCDYVNGLDITPAEKLMVLTADRSADDVPKLIDYMNSRNISFFGGIYPALLVGNNTERQGFIIQKFEPIYCSMVLPYLMSFKLDATSLHGSTAIVLADGLSNKFKDLTDTVFNKIGKGVKYIGGGAGFYDLNHRPCIYDNKGLYKDVLYICIIKAHLRLAVEHGWQKMLGPYLVTRSEGNVLIEIANQNAFEFYNDVIEGIENIRLSKEDFFSFAKEHPFGIDEEGQQNFYVRDPIYVNENNEIVCVANIPEGSDLYILKGNLSSLLGSSMIIAEYCAKRAPARYLPLLFDCISRAMFLEEHFNLELSYIQKLLNCTLEGALSIGEIASQNTGKLIIHNKSTILGLLWIPNQGK